jgi:hypothetical protein
VRGPQKPNESRNAVGVAWYFSSDVQTIGERAARLERVGLVRIQRVRCDGRGHELVPGELLREPLRARQTFRGGFRVRDGKLDDRLAEDAAQSRGFRGAGDLVLEVVHVGVGCRAGFDHLQRRQPRAGADELGRHRLRLGREDVFLQPVHQREIVCKAAEQHHRCVRMRVDQARHDHRARGVEGLSAAVARGNRLGGVYADDVAPVDCHRSARNDLPVSVDGNHNSVGDHEGHGATRRDLNTRERDRQDGRQQHPAQHRNVNSIPAPLLAFGIWHLPLI